jgi:hypothetical protein
LGLPVHVTTEAASLPTVAALVLGGLGPAMAFLVTGVGTSIGAITGAFVIARARVIGLQAGARTYQVTWQAASNRGRRQGGSQQARPSARVRIHRSVPLHRSALLQPPGLI